MTPTQQAKVDEVMDWFDFGKAAKVMEALDWKWVTGSGAMVPDESTLRAEARRLLTSVVGKPERTITGTGGFRVESLGNDNVRLFFVVEHWKTN